MELNASAFPVLVTTIATLGATIWALSSLKSGKSYPLRQLPALAAIDEALGRAAEMGRGALYTTGYGGDLQRPTTLASLGILSYVSEKAAEYDTPISFPTSDPMIMSSAEEVARMSAMRTGHPDRHRPENFQYVGGSQFGYAAAVEREIVRDKPAAVFLLGTFEAEALILAEAGAQSGAMQIAGTDSTIQLGFFLITCDYTLIGEEIFAAAGYLTQDERAIAAIWSQDILKILCALFVVVGIISALLFPTNLWWKF